MNTNARFLTALPILAIALIACGARAQDAPDAPAYVAAKQCKLCHNKPDEGEQFNVWTRMKHSQAFKTLLSEKAVEVAVHQGIDGPPSEAAACLKCHVTGYDPATQSHPKTLAKEDGIQCDSCHGPGSAHMADGKVLRMNKDADVDLMANLVYPDEKTCAQCHNSENPTWDPQRYTLESGETAGFDFAQAAALIAHKNPKKSDGH